MKNNNIIVSMDFDGSLDRQSLQDYSRELHLKGHEVHIVTRRYDHPDKYGELFCQVYGIKDIAKEHQELFVVAEHCAIPVENIHFMNMADKYEFFAANKGFLWHLDDDQFEIDDINQHTETIGISCSNGSNWKHKCERLINKKLNENSKI